MAQNIKPPTHTGITADLVRKSKRRRPTSAISPVPFSRAGAVAVSTSVPWAPHVNTTLATVLALLGTAGTSSTVVTVYVNGSSVGTVTLASGVTSNTATIGAALDADTDIVTMGVTTAGTGAVGLDVIARFS